jgi:phospholipid/cholesterol/gamma-HCH transport system ATP-binding protein
LLKSLLGIHSPEVGSISFDGRVYSDLSAEEKRELRTEIGMVFQGSALFDSMTVEENVGFPLKMFTNNSKSEIQDRVNFVLKRVNLVDANSKFPAEISGGMQKRVAIARAIVNNPKYLFCDEPNSGLDPQTSLVVDKLIMEITKEYNITTIMNTHDMNSVMESGDKIIFLYQGEKRWEGSKEDIIFSKDEKLNNFIFASEFLQEAKKMRMMVAK